MRVVHDQASDGIRETGAASGEVAVAFDQVSHSFRGKPAIDHVSFRIEKGEFATLIGASGCGKTTCLNAVAGELTPDTGQVKVLGGAPATGDQRIGYMFARDSLLPWRTAAENVAFGLESRGVNRAERRKRAAEVLDAVGLSNAHDAYPAQLSHGMRQRVALARTFALNADLLLMDEPFAALDAQTRIMLEDHLMRLWEAQRSTVMFVTHDLAEAILLSERIFLLSASPGRALRVYDVDLPRPRSVTRLQGMPEFHRLYEEIWSDLEEEVNLAMKRERA
ncbi:ABC transporter ATP-binding protein [Amycolatopsis jejuensis]|uniref:ABC transporter ATP-binding protein n=1 Tax=Amycolatopsis jejuensis TaxID=330084 RepID=UPI000A0792EC|nr:ABC transporter ATP-binding protein [Amycolatopsis jejuensis]